jgi:hypothetical protein
MSIIYNPKELPHKIWVKLHPNNLPSAKGTWFARVSNESVLSIEDVARALKNRGGFTGNYHDLVKHVQQFFDEMVYQASDGFTVDTGYFTIHPNVGGVFKSPHEDPSPKNHPVSFSFHARPRLRRLARQIVVKVESGLRPSGSIMRFLDIETGTANGKVTPGHLFSISGHRIKIKGNHPDCGIYFVSVTDPSRIIRAPGPFPQNTSSKISGRIPNLPAGEYFIEIRTQYTIGGIDLKEPRTSTSPFTITVTE